MTGGRSRDPDALRSIQYRNFKSRGGYSINPTSHPIQVSSKRHSCRSREYCSILYIQHSSCLICTFGVIGWVAASNWPATIPPLAPTSSLSLLSNPVLWRLSFWERQSAHHASSTELSLPVTQAAKPLPPHDLHTSRLIENVLLRGISRDSLFNRHTSDNCLSL